MSQLIGFEDLSRKLNELGAAVGGRVLRSALMTSSLPALRSIQAAAPVGTKAHRTYKGRIGGAGIPEAEHPTEVTARQRQVARHRVDWSCD